MKFSYYKFLIPALPLLCLGACSGDDNDDNNASFKIVKTTIDTDPSALSGEIELSADNFVFSINGGDWCEVIKEGNLLKLNAGPNYDFQDRSAEILIESPLGKRTLRVPVTQQGILFELIDKTRTKFNIGLEGGERDVAFLINIPVDVVISEEDQNWISVRDDGSGNYTVFVEPSEERRVGTVKFRYVDKVIPVLINQLDYLSYTEILGEVVLTYWTDDESNGGEERQTNGEIVVKEYGSTYTLKATFSAGVPREIPMEYIEHVVINGEDYNGQFRIRSGVIDANFEDPDNNPRITNLCCYLVADRYFKSNGTQTSDAKNVSNAGYYYPSEVLVEPTGLRFNFINIPGCFPDGLLYTHVAKGFVIQGASAISALGYIYERVYHVSIFKDVN